MPDRHRCADCAFATDDATDAVAHVQANPGHSVQMGASGVTMYRADVPLASRTRPVPRLPGEVPDPPLPSMMQPRPEFSRPFVLPVPREGEPSNAPALSAEGWAEAFGRASWQMDTGAGPRIEAMLSEAADGCSGPWTEPRLASAALALALLGTFSWGDVDTLRRAANDFDGPVGYIGADLQDLADRIASLLPPRNQP